MRSPARPLVAAPATWTCTSSTSRARRRMKSTTDGSSTVGSVSGCTTMEVTPPPAAARAADSSVSLVSEPGSPVLTRRSIRPGASMAPLQSITRTSGDSASKPGRRATSAMTPSATTRAPGPS